MSEGGLLKPEKDFSKEVDQQLPEAQELAKVTPCTLKGAFLDLF